LLLAVLAAFYFGNLLDHGLDAHDAQTFQDNIAIAQDPFYFFSTEKSQVSGRPTAEFFKFVAYLIGGNDPGFFHLLSIALHALASLLLARLVHYLHRDLILSLITGLFFLVTVNHFQAIHHISALDYSLAQVLGIAAVLTFLRAVDDSSNIWRILLPLVLFSLSAGAHISAVVLLPFCLLASWQRAQIVPKSWLVLLVVTTVILPIATLAITAPTTTTWSALDERVDQSLLKLVPDIAGMYLWNLGRLFTTAYWHPLDPAHMQSWEIYIGALALLGLLLLAYKQRGPLSLWITWILLGIAPFALITWDVVLLLPSGASRYLYLASAGTAFATAWILCKAAQNWKRRGQVASYATLTLLCVSSYFSLQSAESVSLYSSARSYIAGGDSSAGIRVLKQLFDQPYRGMAPEDEAYFLLCSAMPYLSEDPTSYLSAGIERFPEHVGLQTVRAALDEQDSSETIRQRGEARMEELYLQELDSGKDQHFLRNLAAVYHNIGIGHAEQGHYKAAEKVLLRTLQIDSGRANTRRVLNRVYVEWVADLEARGLYETARLVSQFIH
jgi:hypothetical protein